MNEALVEAVGFAGLESMVVSGSSRSTANDRLFGASTFPAASVARTRTV